MANGLALLVSADPVTIQQFSVALHELSISSDVCQELPAAVGRLNGQKFDAVIVDLQIGEQSGLILDAVHLSPANRTAVTFAISGSHAEGAAFRKRSEFIFERPQHTQARLRTHTQRTTALFPLPRLHPRAPSEAGSAGSSLQ
jgi:CheY-like chemotaxis protein